MYKINIQSCFEVLVIIYNDNRVFSGRFRGEVIIVLYIIFIQ